MPLTPTRVRAAAAFLAALLAGVAAGCNSTSPSSLPTVGLGFDARGAYADRALYSAEIKQGGGRRVVQGSELAVGAQTSDFLSAGLADIRLGVARSVSVRVALVAAPGDTAAAGTVTWTPAPNFDYGVGAFVGVQRPAGFCFTIRHAIALPPRSGTQGDSLFILESGLPRGAVC